MDYTLSTSQTLILLAVLIWDLTWRGIAMWRAGRNNQKNWFIALLIINSIGLLPIFYLITNPSHEKYKAVP